MCADPSLLGGPSALTVLLCWLPSSSWGYGQGAAPGGRALQLGVRDFAQQPGTRMFLTGKSLVHFGGEGFADGAVAAESALKDE